MNKKHTYEVLCKVVRIEDRLICPFKYYNIFIPLQKLQKMKLSLSSDFFKIIFIFFFEHFCCQTLDFFWL